jgi:Type II secretion system (T2SS), protein E, N-terminal domain
MTLDRAVGAAAAPGAAAIEENPRGGPRHDVPLGTLVLRAGLMDQDELEDALREAVQDGRRLGEVLVEHGLPERDLVRLLAAQHAQPFVDLAHFRVDYEAARLLPPSVARTYCAFAIARDDRGVVVAVPDADDGGQRERLAQVLRRPVRLVAAARSDIKEAISYLGPLDGAAVADAGRTVEPTMFNVVVSLVDGRHVVVARAATSAGADELAARIAAQARVGRVIEGPSVTVDGAEIVSVRVRRDAEEQV